MVGLGWSGFGWSGLANRSSEICALFAVWQEFLGFDALTIAYCHTHTGCFKAVCTNFNGRFVFVFVEAFLSDVSIGELQNFLLAVWQEFLDFDVLAISVVFLCSNDVFFLLDLHFVPWLKTVGVSTIVFQFYQGNQF